jgi:outer membrane phospholipase A
LPPARAVIEVVDSVGAMSQQGQTRDIRLAETASVVSSYARSFEDRLSAHEPIYFIYGGKAPAAKFQFSVKYRLLDLSDSKGRNLRSIQAAYTQRSLWDINGPSSPFYDTSYMPEMFFQALEPISANNGDGLALIGYQTGFKHESNGRAGSTSRSLNTGFFRPFLALGNTEKWHLVIIPEVFCYLGGLGDNADLKNYRGYGQLRAVLSYKNGPVLIYNGLAGKSLDHATTQLDFSVPVHSQRIGLKIYFLLQYFNGCGKSLLRYNEKSESLRAGVSLVR